jgi:hypothetical protein
MPHSTVLQDKKAIREEEQKKSSATLLPLTANDKIRMMGGNTAGVSTYSVQRNMHARCAGLARSNKTAPEQWGSLFRSPWRVILSEFAEPASHSCGSGLW